MAKSILQKDKECYLCRRFYNLRTTRGLEEHERCAVMHRRSALRPPAAFF